MGPTRWLRLGVAAAVIAGAPLVSADADDFDPFLGTYVGRAEVYDADGTLVEERDLDIRIEEGRRGAFVITWFNVTLVDGRRDMPGVVARVDRLTLEPGDAPNVFVEATGGSMFQTRRQMDYLAGDPLRWARIHNNQLGVFSLVVHDDGVYELQDYERVLTEHGMDIDFRRIIDGVVVRRVVGRTIRVD